MAAPSERPPRHSIELEAFVDSDFLTLVESDLAHQTDTALPTVAVSSEDEEFIDRVFSQVRDVDFRAPPPPPVALDGHEKKIGDLREKVRKLERDLARIGHIWSVKHQQINALDDILAKADVARNDALQTSRRVKEQAINVVTAYKQQAQAAQALAQTLGARKAELEINFQRLSEDHAQMSSRLTEQVAKLEREQARSTDEYRQKLENAQETFVHLREQSAHHLGMLQAQLQAREEQTARQQEEISRLQRLVDERDATLEMVRTSAATNYEALRDSSAAALEAQRASSTANYDALKESMGAALEAQKTSSVANYDALKESTGAALEAQRASSAANYEMLRDSSSATLEALRAASAANYEALLDSSSATLDAHKTASAAALEALRATSVAEYEALRESGSAALELQQTTSRAMQDELKSRLAEMEKVWAVARTEIDGLHEQVAQRDTSLAQSEQRYQETDRQHHQRYQEMDRQHQQRYQDMDRQHEQRYQEMDGQHQMRINTLEAVLQQLRESSAAAIESLRLSGGAALESLQTSSGAIEAALQMRLVEVEKAEAVARSQIVGLDEQVRQRDAGLAQTEQRFADMERLHQMRISALEAALEQLKENTALDQTGLKHELMEAQKEMAISQARITALQVQAQEREEAARVVAHSLADRERTTAQLIDEIGTMRVEQERRLTEKREALRASYDEVARLQGGLGQAQTELAHLQSLYEVTQQERDAFQKLIPPHASP